jgi:hypothetical protein
MILWNKNIKMNSILINKTYNFIDQDIFFDAQNNFYTSYFSKIELKDLSQYYAPIIDKIMKDLTLYHRANCRWFYWVQMYNNELNGHKPHHHFDKFTILSWVHFIKVPNRQKCFYFLTSENTKIYPQKQFSGDFIVFPSWALHGVDKIIGKNTRMVVAGNILLDEIENNY